MADLQITGPALTLRYARPEDAQPLFELARDPEVTQFFSWRYESVEDAEEWIAELPGKRERGELLELVIDSAEGPVGVTSLMELVARDRRAFVGTWLGRGHWGSGANFESKAMMAALAFGPLGLGRLSAYASSRNPRSQRAIERIGFVREGELREWHRHGQLVHDVLVYGLLRSDWEASALREVPVEIEGDAPAAYLP